MGRTMPPLGTAFAKSAAGSIAIAQAGEFARTDAPPGSRTHRELRPSRLEALYEMAYLRVFIAWEDFLEETFVRYLAGFETPTYKPDVILAGAPFRKIDEARVALYSGSSYLLWHNPGKTLTRCARCFNQGIHSQVIGSDLTRLEWFASVRHRIAHGSDQVKQQMDSASMQLAGRRYPASSAGRFVRDWKTDDPMAYERWLRAITNELTSLAFQLAP